MAEALLVFDDIVTAPDGTAYRACVCGRQAADGRWEGWIEFDPIATGADGRRSESRVTLHTGRETTQPKRADLLYWAGGLTHTFLEGALIRALGVHGARALPRRTPEPGDGPARPNRAQPGRPRAPQPGTRATTQASRTSPAPAGRPVLDPFEVFLQGEEVLRQELGALSPAHLRTIVDAYRLDVDDALRDGDHAALVRAIVAAVRERFSGLEARPQEGAGRSEAPRA
jgi:hypothetical protein